MSAHATYFYPHLKRDADLAHAVLHHETCLCTQSLESMAREVREAAEGVNPALVSAAREAILSLRLIASLSDFVGVAEHVRTSAAAAADGLERAIS